MSMNGFIARKDDSTPWSEEEWDSYAALIKKAGNVIVGRKTYDIMCQQHEFDKLGKPFIVVVSHTPVPDANVAASPEKALELIKEKGFEQAVIGGGQTINTYYLAHKLVDEVIIDIEPFFFGSGVPFTSAFSFDYDLSLLATKKLSQNTIQLHYKIL